MLQADSLTECRAVSAVSTSHGSQQGAPQSARGLLRADRAKWRGANSCIIPSWTRHVLCQVSGQTPALFPAGHGTPYVRCPGKLLYYSQLDTAGVGANSCIIPSWTRQVSGQTPALFPAGHGTSYVRCRVKLLHYSQLDTAGVGANSCIIPSWTRHVLCQVSGQTPALFPAGHGTSYVRCRLCQTWVTSFPPNIKTTPF